MSEGSDRIAAAFAAAQGTAFIPYVMVGDPDVATSARYVEAIGRHADLIELGVPFSDPLADGPTIQASGQRALRTGATPQDALAVAAQLRDGPPICVMTYLNTVLAPGPRVFMERAAAAGVAGLLIPDLPIDESDDIREAAGRAGVALVPFAAPTSSDERLTAIGRRADGFVYCVAVTGVTGGGISVDALLTDFLARARAAIDAPLAVGFGVRTPADAALVGAHADGVIVGSELIRIIEDAGSPDAAVDALDAYGASIRAALAAAPTG